MGWRAVVCGGVHAGCCACCDGGVTMGWRAVVCGGVSSLRCVRPSSNSGTTVGISGRFVGTNRWRRSSAMRTNSSAVR